MQNPADTVTLRVPRQDGFMRTVRMVLGGIATRKDLSFDALDDLLLAVETLLAEDSDVDDLSVSVTVSEAAVEVRLEPLSGPDLYATLRSGRVPEGAEGRCLDVCLLLESLVDAYRIEGEAGGQYAVIVEKATE